MPHRVHKISKFYLIPKINFFFQQPSADDSHNHQQCSEDFIMFVSHFNFFHLSFSTQFVRKRGSYDR